MIFITERIGVLFDFDSNLIELRRSLENYSKFLANENSSAKS